MFFSVGKFFGKFVLVSAALFLTGCSTTPVFVDLHPAATTQAMFNGNQIPVNLIVYDKRDKDALGYYGFDNKGREYFLKQNLSAAVSKSMYHIIHQNNFALANMTNRSLTVNILALQFAAVDNLTNTDLSSETALEVVAIANGKVFRKIYHGNIEDSTFLYVQSDHIQNDINNSVTEALNNIASDHNLWQFLMEK